MSDFSDYCCELLSSLGPCKARRMFGGHGISYEGINVAIIAYDRLYLKVDAQTTPEFQAAGCEIFAYERQDKPAIHMSYWTAPESAMDSPNQMAPWARLALEAALRSKSKARPKKVKPAKIKT